MVIRKEGNKEKNEESERSVEGKWKNGERRNRRLREKQKGGGGTGRQRGRQGDMEAKKEGL